MIKFDAARREHLLLALGALLLLPAFFTNLGLLAFIDDETIRSLVALEMKISGNYIAPTIHGDFYYRKPPLFNWILLFFYEITGRINEWTTRLPTVFFLFIYTGVIWLYTKTTFGNKKAIINALIFLTCGRILFWDSMLGLIDITFSMVMYLLFMMTYTFEKRGKHTLLFLSTYLLASIGYLLKGLPALVFIGVTLLVWYGWKRQLKKLFSLSHLAGIALMGVILGGYYYLYINHNSMLDQLGENLLDESARRTVVNYGWGKTIQHLFTFPFEMVYHFLPWALMIIYFIRRDIWQVLRENEFIFFNFLVFMANILLYWASPEVYPRYVLMHAPLIFTVYYYLHTKNEEEKSWQWKVLDVTMGILLFILIIGSLTPLFLQRSSHIPLLVPKSAGLFFLFSWLAFSYQRWKEQRMLIMVVALLAFRLGFDWFVLPDRNANDFGDLCRQDAKLIALKYAEKPLFLAENTFDIRFSGFYITEKTRKIIRRAKPEDHPDAYFIFDKVESPELLQYPVVDSLRIRRDNRHIYVAHISTAE